LNQKKILSVYSGYKKNQLPFGPALETQGAKGQDISSGIGSGKGS
jgi:hypothetical protein